MMDRLNEDFRRWANLVICWGSWMAAFVMTWWVIADVHRRPYGVIVVFLIGVGVTASLIRSRYRLAETIAETFNAGVRVGRSGRLPVTTKEESPHPHRHR